MKSREIQWLRGIAITLVLLFHLDQNIFPSGYLGVDMFFVVSGYLILPKIKDLYENSISAKVFGFELSRFYRRRLQRLFPAYALTSLISILSLLIFGGVDYILKSIQLVQVGLLGFANFWIYKFTGDYFHQENNPFLHLWSLSVEEQLYISIPLASLLIYLFRRRIFRFDQILFWFSLISFVSTFLSLLFAQAIQSVFKIQSIETLVFYSPTSRFWEFGIGGLFAIHNPRIKKLNSFQLLVLQIVAFFFAAILHSYLINELLKLFICLTTAFLLIQNQNMQFMRPVVVLITRILEWIGDRSYVIYLLHYPFIWLASNSAVARSLSRMPRYFLAMVLTLILADFIHKYFEFRFIKNNRIDRDMSIVPSKILYNFIFSIMLFLIVLSQCVSHNFFDLQNTNYYKNSNIDLKPLAAWEGNTKCSFLYSNSPCELSLGSSTKEIILFGDSHSAQFAITLRDIAFYKGYRLIVWTKANCNYFDPAVLSEVDISTSQIRKVSSKECETHNLRLRKLIQNSGNAYLITSPRFTSSSNEIADYKYRNLIQKSLNKLVRSPKELILISQNPEFPVNYGPQMRTFWQKNSEYKVLKSKMDPRALLDNFWSKRFAASKNYPFIDLENILCPINICSNMRNHKLTYWDENHLSVIGANLAKSSISSKIQNLHS